jgi:hypothetical protein
MSATFFFKVIHVACEIFLEWESVSTYCPQKELAAKRTPQYCFHKDSKITLSAELLKKVVLSG